MPHEHRYQLQLSWCGNLGSGTSGYRAYSRAHQIRAAGKPVLAGSADPVLRGDAERYHPEELLLAALAACHMLWFLHLCADEGVVVHGYEDQPSGTLPVDASGGARLREALLQPAVTLAAASAPARLAALHERAHALCFTAHSVSFPVRCQPLVAKILELQR
jgi:organic hydroperoxide reductase OsmC/OhrA